MEHVEHPFFRGASHGSSGDAAKATAAASGVGIAIGNGGLRFAQQQDPQGSKLGEIPHALQNLSGAHDQLDMLLNDLAQRIAPITTAHPSINKARAGDPEPVYGSQIGAMIQGSASRADSFNQRLRELLDSLAI